VENMPGGAASRPGDIVVSRSGLSIKIDNTDAEGRLILCDALDYANEFQPSTVIDVATLTGACHIALGAGACAMFTNNTQLFKGMYQAGVRTGDRVWRMPVYQQYTNRMKTDFADLNNIAKPNSGGGSCTAAAFLKEFTKCESWAHLDIAGVSGIFNDGEIPYINKGMSGRPTRTLVEWLSKLE
jgi:aminopeptidase